MELKAFEVRVRLHWNGEDAEEVKSDLLYEIENPDSMLFQTVDYSIRPADDKPDIKTETSRSSWVKKLSLNDNVLGRAVYSDTDHEWLFTPNYADDYWSVAQLQVIADQIAYLNKTYPKPEEA